MNAKSSDEFLDPPRVLCGWPWHKPFENTLPSALPEWPRITLITPSFNQGAFIEQTIRSVLLQNYPNLEYIVIDGGSTDETVSILKRYSPWIDYWVSENDEGQSDAINKGLALATGQWFNWLNSDDYLQPGALFALVSATFSDNPVCVTGVTSNLRNGHVFSSYQAHLPSAPADFLFSLRVNQPGSLLHVASVREVGGVRQDLRLVMDLDVWLRLGLTRGPQAFKQVAKKTAVYRYHETSKTCSGLDVFACEEFVLLTDLALSLGANLPNSIRHFLVSLAGVKTGEWPLPPFALEPPSIESAWLDRMVISDSLLFRAMRASQSESNGLLYRFGQVLNSLDLLLERHSTLDPAQTKAKALLHAMQILGRAEPRFAMAIIRNDFRIPTIRSLARLVFRL